MLANQENIFNVPHSLPNSAHPVALATRTPTGLVKVDSTKFMPDYGGLLEIPGTKSKQYCLGRGVPFHINPNYVHIIGSCSSVMRKNTDEPNGLVITTHLDSDQESGSMLSVIRAIGSTLYFNALKDIPCQTTDMVESHTYSHVPYPYQISGLKYCDTLNRFLIVKFEQGVKLVQFNQSYKISAAYRTPESSDTEEEETSTGKVLIPDNRVVNFVGSFPERRGLHLGDACLTTSQRTLAMASSDNSNIFVKLYDINRSKKFHETIIKPRDDDARLATEAPRNESCSRKRTLRSFVPLTQTHELMQQLECDPSHLIQMVLITSNRVSQVDIRSKVLEHNYVDRSKLLSILPKETFRQIVFSKRTDQQFYLLSNERVRAFDKRFLSQPVTSQEHMLDPETYTSMRMKLICYEESGIETLCISSYGRLCFLSFDRGNRTETLVAHSGDLVNPVSIHSPLHEPSPAELAETISSELFGLDVSDGRVFAGDKVAFSVFQLSAEGDICVRAYEKLSDELRPTKIQSQKKSVLVRHRSRKHDPESIISNLDNDYSYIRRRRRLPEIPDDECLNVLDASSIVCAEDKLTSKRALEKFDLMKKKLYKR